MLVKEREEDAEALVQIPMRHEHEGVASPPKKVSSPRLTNFGEPNVRPCSSDMHEGVDSQAIALVDDGLCHGSHILVVTRSGKETSIPPEPKPLGTMGETIGQPPISPKCTSHEGPVPPTVTFPTPVAPLDGQTSMSDTIEPANQGEDPKCQGKPMEQSKGYRAPPVARAVDAENAEDTHGPPSAELLGMPRAPQGHIPPVAKSPSATNMGGEPTNQGTTEEPYHTVHTEPSVVDNQEAKFLDPLDGDPGEEWFHVQVPLSTPMMVAVSGEQWLNVLEHGITSGPDGKIHGFGSHGSPPPWADIVVHIDVPLCQADGINILQDNQGGLYTHGSTLRGILFPKYFLKAVDVPTGWQIYPEETGSEIARREEMEMGNAPAGDAFMDLPPGDLDVSEQGPIGEEEDLPSRPMFRFQSQLPPEERAAYQRSRLGVRGGIPPRAGTHVGQGAVPFTDDAPTLRHVMDRIGTYHTRRIRFGFPRGMPPNLSPWNGPRFENLGW